MAENLPKEGYITKQWNKYGRGIFYATKPTPYRPLPIERMWILTLRIGSYILAAASIMFIFLAPLLDADKIVLTLCILALVGHVKSGLFFGTAIILVIYTPLLLTTNQTELSNNFSTYIFYILCFGIVSAILQLQQEDRHK